MRTGGHYNLQEKNARCGKPKLVILSLASLRQAGPWNSLASQPHLFGDLQAVRIPALPTSNPKCQTV